jgi:hypothetical protein
VPEDARFCPFCTESIVAPPEEGEPTPDAAEDPRSGVAGSEERPVAAPTHFADFELRAWAEEGGTVQVLVHNSPAGDTRRPVEVDADLDRLRGIRQTLDTIQWRRPAPRDSSQLSEASPGLQLMAQAGRELTRVLLPTPVFALLQRSLDRIAPDSLRIRLCLDASLVDLPWEFLYRPDLPGEDALAGFLVLDSRISLVREAPVLVPGPVAPGEKQRMVFAGAPFRIGDGDYWGVQREYQHLEEALQGVADLLAIEYVSAAAEGIPMACLEPASMFHYTGHTDRYDDRGFLVQEMGPERGQGGQYQVWEHPSYVEQYGVERLYVDLMYAEELAASLRRAGVRLAVFSACNSGRWPFVRPLLRAGLPAVIGNQGMVSAGGARGFCHKLYTSLAIGLSLDEAVTWARLHLLEPGVSRLRESYEWGTFMVYMPSTESVLFPQPAEREAQKRQAQARLERLETINIVVQNIGTVQGGTVVGFGGG